MKMLEKLMLLICFPSLVFCQIDTTNLKYEYNADYIEEGVRVFSESLGDSVFYSGVHKNGNLACRYKKVKNVFLGKYMAWYSNQQIQVLKEFSDNGDPIGTCFYYYPNGQLQSIQEYFKSPSEILREARKDTLEIEEDGIIRQMEVMHVQTLSENGIYRRYYENGNIAEKGLWVKGRKEGEWEHYLQNGEKYKIQLWQKGELIKEELFE